MDYINVKTKKNFLEEFEKAQLELVDKKVFKTSLTNVDNAIEWYSEIAEKLFLNSKSKLKSILAFEELFMNAYEHGNLEIDKETKCQYVRENKYFSTLKELEKKCNKKIEVKVYKLLNYPYIGVEICDEGEGFNVYEVDSGEKAFNGRGILMALKTTQIYYNLQGNCVFFVSKYK